MNKYLIKFIEIFQTMLEKYQFKLRSYYDDDHSGVIIIYNDKFELHFAMWRETTEIIYCKLLPNNQIQWHNITNYVISQMKDNDRIIIDETEEEQNKHIVVYNRNVRSLKYRFNTLNNHFSDLLSGNERWLKRYEKSEWYDEPIIRDRKI